MKIKKIAIKTTPLNIAGRIDKKLKYLNHLGNLNLTINTFRPNKIIASEIAQKIKNPKAKEKEWGREK